MHVPVAYELDVVVFVAVVVVGGGGVAVETARPVEPYSQL